MLTEPGPVPASGAALELDQIQGNILRPFARRNAVYLLLQLSGGDAAGLRRGLFPILRRYVTTASRQAELSRQWQETRTSDGVGMCGLSWTGFERLGLADAAPKDPELGADLFRQGLLAPGYWTVDAGLLEPVYQSLRIDAFLLLADDDAARLAKATASARSALGDLVTRIQEEPVQRRIAQDGGARVDLEPFGFRDGISRTQPPEDILTAEALAGDGSPPSLGCFAALMKLEQDAAAFRRKSEELSALAAQHQISVSAEEIEELAVGRKRSGEPLVPRGKNQDDFLLQGAPASACPFHSHIRAMNPRDSSAVPKIIRRGMPYGPEDSLQGPSGLMFLSLHRSLLDFQFLMVRALRLRDPLLSRSSHWTALESPDNGCAEGGRPGQKWTFPSGSGEKEICFPLADLTAVRGGEFFFLPSIRFLTELAET